MSTEMTDHPVPLTRIKLMQAMQTAILGGDVRRGVLYSRVRRARLIVEDASGEHTIELPAAGAVIMCEHQASDAVSPGLHDFEVYGD
jgi:hypothetical protein